MNSISSAALWRALDCPGDPEAVERVWRSELGAEFDAARPFLRPSPAPTRSYPCPHQPPCGCHHRIIRHAPSRIVAVCQCEDPDCPPVPLSPQDCLVLGLDYRKFSAAICAALDLQTSPPGQLGAARRSHQVGLLGPTQAPVILSFPVDANDLYSEFCALAAAIPGPFVLLTASARYHDPTIVSVFRKHGHLHLPLAWHLSLVAPGKLTATPEVKAILATFSRHAQILLPPRAGTGKRSIGQSGSDSAASSALDSELQAPTSYAIHKDGDCWTITFNGQAAAKKHEKGLLYVAWLLTNPPKDPIHAMELVAKVPAIYRRQLGLTSTVDETTGKQVAFAADAMPQERTHAADDLLVARRVLAAEREWEAVLDDDDATEPEKAEALSKLEELADFQRRHAMRSRGNAERLVRAVRVAITRLHANLAKATDTKGRPHPVLRPFADHLTKHLITPSARYNGRMGARTRAGVAGRFTYEPPKEVKWSS